MDFSKYFGNIISDINIIITINCEVLENVVVKPYAYAIFVVLEGYCKRKT